MLQKHTSPKAWRNSDEAKCIDPRLLMRQEGNDQMMPQSDLCPDSLVEYEALSQYGPVDEVPASASPSQDVDVTRISRFLQPIDADPYSAWVQPSSVSVAKADTFTASVPAGFEKLSSSKHSDEDARHDPYEWRTASSSASQADTATSASTVVTSSTDPSSVVPSQRSSEGWGKSSSYGGRQQDLLHAQSCRRESQQLRQDQSLLDPRLRSDPDTSKGSLTGSVSVKPQAGLTSMHSSSATSSPGISWQNVTIDEAGDIVKGLPRPWRCWHSDCQDDSKKSQTEFNLASLFKKHWQVHIPEADRPIACLEVHDGERCIHRCWTPKDLRRHHKSKQQDGPECWCPVAGCGTEFTRHDNRYTLDPLSGAMEEQILCPCYEDDRPGLGNGEGWVKATKECWHPFVLSFSSQFAKRSSDIGGGLWSWAVCAELCLSFGHRLWTSHMNGVLTVGNTYTSFDGSRAVAIRREPCSVAQLEHSIDSKAGSHTRAPWPSDVRDSEGSHEGRRRRPMLCRARTVGEADAPKDWLSWTRSARVGIWQSL
nr:hypothetical protein CFP56_20905 [Quercus suber]